MDNSPIDILRDWLIYAISFVASIVSFATVYKLEDSWKLTALKFFVHYATALFAAWMMYLLISPLKWNPAWVMLAVGISAWRGSAQLKRLSSKLDKLAGLDPDPNAVDGSGK